MSEDEFQYLSDPQARLKYALDNFNLDEFRFALDMGADPLLLDDNKVCIFEKALATYDCAVFVNECLKHGCSVNYRNPYSQKPAFNSAADSMDVEIMNVLICSKGIIGFDCTFNSLTPLNSLAKNLSNQNFNKVLDCIIILLEKDASRYVPDENGMTPLHYILQNNKLDELLKHELLHEFFKTKGIDYASFRDGELESILYHDYNDMPEEFRSAKNILMKLIYLIHKNAEKFRDLFEIYKGLDKVTYEKFKPLLQEAIQFRKNKILDILLVHDDLVCDEMVIYAMRCGNAYALKELLKTTKIKVNINNTFFYNSLLLLREDSKWSELCNYRSCFYVLLESEKFDINELGDNNCSALQMAIDMEDKEAIAELLKRGAFIEPSIARMDAGILEQHFDSCITSNKLKMSEETFKIFIDYKNFPSEVKSQLNGVETTAISHIAASENHRHLLKHPLITSLLFLKWSKLDRLIYLNILFFTLFAFSTIGNATLKVKNIDFYILTMILSMCSWICIGYMALRETLQFVMSPRHYLSSITNYKELALIILSTLSSIQTNFDVETQKAITVSGFLLIAWELCDILGSLPFKSISVHMLMMKTVCKTFIKSFALYSIFVLTFCLCFYILFGKGADEVSPGEEFHSFREPGTTLLKIVVMFTGELEASSLDYNSKFCTFFLLIFILFMTIVLLNLLNGLAISDTQKVMDLAELTAIIYRINLLERYEELITLHSGKFNSILNRKLFRSIMKILKLHPVMLGCQKLYIKPNQKKRIGTVSQNLVNLEDHEIGVSLRPTLIWMEDVKMDEETVNLAKSIIIKKNV